MTLIVRLIAKYALWIYILCGVGMIFYVRAALAARTEGVQAMFSLEREQAAKRVYRSSGMILVLLLIVVGVYGLTNHVDLPPVQADPDKSSTPSPAGTETLTAEALETSVTGTVDQTPLPEEGTPAPTLEPTPTRKPRLTSVVVPTLSLHTPTPQVSPAVCPHPNVQVIQPGQNQVIDAGSNVRGTALKEAFDRYEFKFQSRDLVGDEWHWVETFRTPVQNGDLGYWHTAHLPPGRYRFLLIVIDQSGNSQECVVPIVIQH